MRLRFTRRGAAELDEVLSYIESHARQGADRVRARIQGVIDLLLQHP